MLLIKINSKAIKQLCLVISLFVLLIGCDGESSSNSSSSENITGDNTRVVTDENGNISELDCGSDNSQVFIDGVDVCAED